MASAWASAQSLRRRSRVVVRTALAAITGAAVATALASPARAVTPAAAAGSCPPAWSVRTLATGLGTLENLVPDGVGGLVLSVNESAGRLLRLTPDGTVRTIATDLPLAGGLARDGQWLYVTTGDNALSGLLGTADGTVVRLRVDGGGRTEVARGLVAPNGLARLPDGALVTTRTLSSLIGTPSAVTRVGPQGTLTPVWSTLDGTNGVALDPGGAWLYVNRSLAGETWRIPVADPTRAVRVATHPPLSFPDDLTVVPAGLVSTRYLAGEVVRVDPATGTTCVLARGLAQASSVRQGDGAGLPSDRLYVTSHSGTVYELTAP